MATSLGGYATLVRQNRNFRYLWFGEIVSLLGDWFNFIASATLIGALSGSGVALGGLFVVRMLAPFLVSAFGGVIVDRYNRKTILIVTDLVRGLVVLGFLFVRTADHIPLLYLLTAIQLGISGLFFPARNAIFPDVVGREELGTANALSSSTWSTMLALGTALGGFVAGGLGVYAAFTIDALSFFLSAWLIAQLRYTPSAPQTAGEKSVSAVLREYVEGIQYLRNHRDILAIVLHKAAVTFCFAAAYDVTAVAISQQVFVYGAGGGLGLGFIYATVGLGTGVGPILLRTFTGDRERALRHAIVVAYLTAASGMVLAALMVNSGYSFALFLVGLFFRGFGGGSVWVFATQLALQNVADHVRGRVFSTEFALFSLSSAVAAGAAGWALEQPVIGYQRIVWILPVLTLVPALLWGLWIWGHRQRPLAPVVPEYRADG
ncbi:MAG: MFS transporter [Caldilinea sp. CFX5]|nr:MFS transporter [Caldilinea sp. CFX5]